MLPQWWAKGISSGPQGGYYYTERATPWTALQDLVHCAKKVAQPLDFEQAVNASLTVKAFDVYDPCWRYVADNVPHVLSDAVRQNSGGGSGRGRASSCQLGSRALTRFCSPLFAPARVRGQSVRISRMVAEDQAVTAAVTSDMQIAFAVIMSAVLLFALLYMHSLFKRLASDRVCACALHCARTQGNAWRPAASGGRVQPRRLQTPQSPRS